MNKKYLIGIYQISKQNNYIVTHALYSYARIVKLRTQARGKRKYMLCFEVGLSPSGLPQPQVKAYTSTS